MAGQQKAEPRGYQAAARRFPGREQAISKLMDQSDQFAEICEELADAESALANLGDLPQAVQRERNAEWDELITRLVSELDAYLH